MDGVSIRISGRVNSSIVTATDTTATAMSSHAPDRLGIYDPARTSTAKRHRRFPSTNHHRYRRRHNDWRECRHEFDEGALTIGEVREEIGDDKDDVGLRRCWNGATVLLDAVTLTAILVPLTRATVVTMAVVRTPPRVARGAEATFGFARTTLDLARGHEAVCCLVRQCRNRGTAMLCCRFPTLDIIRLAII